MSKPDPTRTLRDTPRLSTLRRDPRMKGSALRRPLRLWMTGSVAVLMAAFVPSRGLEDSDAVEVTQRHVRLSPYDLHETLQRIEAAARTSGLTVLARMGGAEPVIVLASSVGGTPVMMDEASARMEVPLSVRLQRGANGAVEVSIPLRGDAGATLAGLPVAVAADVAALPDLVARALA